MWTPSGQLEILSLPLGLVGTSGRSFRTAPDALLYEFMFIWGVEHDLGWHSVLFVPPFSWNSPDEQLRLLFHLGDALERSDPVQTGSLNLILHRLSRKNWWLLLIDTSSVHSDSLGLWETLEMEKCRPNYFRASDHLELFAFSNKFNPESCSTIYK